MKLIRFGPEGQEKPGIMLGDKIIDLRQLFPDIPDIDLLIRTSGEERISNFMLWQISYAELYFTPVLWPDFSVEKMVAETEKVYLSLLGTN